MLNRLHQFAIHSFGDDLRFANHQLVAFTAHHLDQDRELQFAATHHDERIGAAGVFYPQRNVRQQFFFEPLAQVSRGHIVAITPGKRRDVHGKQHGDRRVVNRDRRQRRRIVSIGDGLANRDALNACDRDDISELRHGDVRSLKS